MRASEYNANQALAGARPAPAPGARARRPRPAPAPAPAPLWTITPRAMPRQCLFCNVRHTLKENCK
jgi:hypothetical protein